jgi:hypothetical protein
LPYQEALPIWYGLLKELLFLLEPELEPCVTGPAIMVATKTSVAMVLASTRRIQLYLDF